MRKPFQVLESFHELVIDLHLAQGLRARCLDRHLHLVLERRMNDPDWTHDIFHCYIVTILLVILEYHR